MKKIYAFWKYDRYPYLLSQPVEESEIDGIKVSPAAYSGYRFKAKFFLPNAAGKQLADKLEQLTIQERKELQELNLKFKNLLEETLNEYNQTLK